MIELLVSLTTIYIFQVAIVAFLMVMDGIHEDAQLFNCRRNIIVAFIPFGWIYGGLKYVVTHYKGLK